MGGVRVVPYGIGARVASMLVNSHLVRSGQGLRRVRDLLRGAQIRPPRRTGLLSTSSRTSRVLPSTVERSQEALRSALDEIRESEATLRQTIDTIPTLAWCTLPDGFPVFLNQRWHEYTGLTSQESEGWGWQVTIYTLKTCSS